MQNHAGEQRLRRERWRLLRRIERGLDKPMIALGIAWLVLLVLELTRGLSPPLAVLSSAIWVAFIVEFLLKLALAPRKLDYLKSRWLNALALFVPALRIARVLSVFRFLRFARGARLVRLMTTLNKGLSSLGRTMKRRGAAHVFAVTLVVLFAGAAGMLAFERNEADPKALNSYGTALWWTFMLLTTIGSEYWPKSPEGRMLCVFLSLYAVAVLGYVAATLATYFIGRDAESDKAEVAGSKQIESLRAEIHQLRRLLEDHSTKDA